MDSYKYFMIKLGAIKSIYQKFWQKSYISVKASSGSFK